MCNRYASDIRKACMEKEYYGFEEWSETRITPLLGNALLEVFPKSIGPVIVRAESDALEWRRMRWGLPGPAATGGAPVTNVRNTSSSHWRPVLGVEHRCLVLFTAFSEYEDASPKGAKQIRWFAPPDRGMLFFAGIWRVWSGDYGSKKEPNVGEHHLFSFLTTEANDLVRPIHRKRCRWFWRSPKIEKIGLRPRRLLLRGYRRGCCPQIFLRLCQAMKRQHLSADI